MPSRVLDLLDRQYKLLRDKEGAQFLQELRRFYQFITAGPDEVVAAVTELRDEAEAIAERFEEHDRALVQELAELKAELASRAPEADDSRVPRPQSGFGPAHEWTYGFSNFDQIVTDGPDRFIEHQDRDLGKSGMLIRILRAKLDQLQWMTVSPRGLPTRSETNQRQDLDDLGRRLGNLADRHRHEKHELLQAFDQHGGFQIRYLALTVSEMNPPPRQIETDQDHERRVNDLFKRWAGGWDAIQSAMSGGHLDATSRQMLDYHLRQLRPAAERVYEDLRLKAATAPPPPEPEEGYSDRWRAWVHSPEYQLLGGPCLAGAIGGLVTGQHAGLIVFILLATGLAVVPPALAHRPAITYTRATLAFAGLATIAMVSLLVTVGLLPAIATFLLLVAAFALGQRARP